MRAVETSLPGLLVLEPAVHGDERGFFQETYRESTLAEAGIRERFVQDNHSRSSRGVLRGMHFQTEPGQAKLVRCARGAVLDVVVDIRRGSPTFGHWAAHQLDDAAHHQLYIPIGFAHGFCVLSETADVVYKCSSYYDGATEGVISYADPEIGIEWPDMEHTVSARDADAPSLSEVAEGLPFSYAG